MLRVTVLMLSALSWILIAPSGIAADADPSATKAPARAASADAAAPKTSAEEDPPVKIEQAAYPDEVALVSEQPKGWIYRESTNRLPLYVSDKDSPGKSTCYDGCDTQWIPLFAPPKAKAKGEWTLVARRDGRHQWAYQKRPVYVRIHDSPESPTGDGVDGVWHLLPYIR